jgi:hypothetical protein
MIGESKTWPATGVNWDLPVLMPVGVDQRRRAKHAFFVTLWWYTGTEPLQDEWHWVGNWDAATATWTLDHSEPRSSTMAAT